MICKVVEEHDIVEELARDFPILCMLGLYMGLGFVYGIMYSSSIVFYITPCKLHPVRMYRFMKNKEEICGRK